MQYFEPFSPTLLTTNELTAFAVSLDKLARTVPSQDGYVPRQLDPIALAVSKIDQLNGRITANEWTEKLSESDRDRDDLYSALVGDLKNNLRKKKAAPARVEPSEKLLVIIGANPVDVKSGYQNESTQLR